jgi:peptidoglycan/LPS O-acetylase OafA/YrhL
MKKLGSREWNPGIEGLRGFSILLVFTFHLSNNKTHNWGALGVAIFFVISGYVITGSIARELLGISTSKVNLFSFLKNFYSRRAVRLLPISVLVIFVSLLISQFDSSSDKKQYLLSALFCLFYVGNLFGFTFGYTELAPALGHFWSLAIEVQFYFVWPIIFFFTFKNIAKLTRLTSLVAIGIFVIAISHPLIAISGKTVWTLPTTYLDLLLLGCLFRLLATQFENLEGHNLKFIQLAGLLSLLAIIFLEKSSAGIFTRYFEYNLNFLLVGIVFVFALNSNFFDNIFLKFFGRISYSLYCIHIPMIIFCRSFVGDSALAIFMTSIISVLLSYLSYRYYESRFYKPSFKR